MTEPAADAPDELEGMVDELLDGLADLMPEELRGDARDYVLDAFAAHPVARLLGERYGRTQRRPRAARSRSAPSARAADAWRCAGRVNEARARHSDTERNSPAEARAQAERARVRAAVEAMGESGRVLALRYFEGHDWETVAQELGVSVGTAQRRHDAAVERLVAAVVGRNR